LFGELFCFCGRRVLYGGRKEGVLGGSGVWRVVGVIERVVVAVVVVVGRGRSLEELRVVAVTTISISW
jgi:hypothetical protein